MALEENETSPALYLLTGEWQDFTFPVQSKSQILCEMTGGDGDADLYLRFGNFPNVTAAIYDCIAAGSTSVERCTVENRGNASIVYLTVTAYSRLTDVYVTCRSSELPEYVKLIDGISSEPLGLEQGENRIFFLDVENTESVVCETAGDNGDADLYTSTDVVPDFIKGIYDCESATETSYEECVVADLNSTSVIYVMVNAYVTFSDLVVTCSSRTQTTSTPIPLESGIPSEIFSLRGGQGQIFQMELTTFMGAILCIVHAENGDADLYVRLGSEPDLNLGQYDCASETTESDEQCEVYQTVNSSTTVYAIVMAFSTFDNATLSCSPVVTTNEGKTNEAPGSGPAGSPSGPASPGTSNDDIKTSSNDESTSSSDDGTKLSSDDTKISTPKDDIKSSSDDDIKKSSNDDTERVSSNDDNVPVALEQEHSPSISKASDQTLHTLYYASLKLMVVGMLISFAASNDIFT